MITKGILKTIDYNNNSCKVRLPLFENSNNKDEVILPAVFLSQPGIYNGYAEGDIVFVDFESDKLSQPVILGKLYLGAAKEAKTEKKGSIEASNLTISNTATLPLTTKLTIDDVNTKQAVVDNRYSNYKSFLDIINAINTTEENFNIKLKNSSDHVITNITTEYLIQKEKLDAPTKENPNWSISMPDLEDGYDIWQKTTCYNTRGQIVGVPEIVCLTGVAASFVYNLATSTKVHTGTAQTEKIVVEAKVKIGTQTETLDANALLKYSWSDNDDWKEASNKNKFEIETTDCLDKDLIIKAYHQIGKDLNENPIYSEDEYATETITFIAQNTPTLDLSRDSASIAYDSFGEDKINLNDEVSTTATLYFNGQVVEGAKYTWDYDTDLCEATVNGNTITISDLADSVETVELTCSTKCNEVSLSKVFTVTKVLQGKSPYKIDIVNEFVSIITESDGVIPTDYPWTTNTLHTANIYYGDKLVEVTEEKGIKVGTETPTGGSDLYLKYTITTGLTAGTPTQVSNTTASFTNKASALGNDVDRGEIKYELYEGTVLVASEKFELVRIKCGEAAMHYTGKTSTNTIKRDPAGNLTPGTITIWLDKTVGHDTNTVNATDYQLYYSKTKADSLKQLEASESKGISINKDNKWTINTNKLGIQGQLSLDFRVQLGDSSDFTTISMMDIPVVNDGESVDVEYAYWWSDSYYDSNNKMWDLEAPTSVLTQETTAAETWFKPSTIPTINSYTNCKIIFVSRRMGIASEIDSAPWSKPEMFAVASSEAYKTLSIAEGLFGYGQGVYYTYDKEQVDKAPTSIQLVAGGSQYSHGTRIDLDQLTIAKWIATGNGEADPLDSIENRKKVIKLYIDAKYIRTGAFTVGNASNPLFQAGLDTGTNKTPIVKIAGFDVTTDKISKGTLGNASSISMSPTGLSGSINNESKDNWGLTLGSNFGVDLNGNLKAATGQLGSWSLTNDWLGVGTVGQNGSTFLFPNGYSATVGNESKSNWGLTLGANFGVDTDGSMIATAGKIGGFSLGSTTLTAGNTTSNNFIKLSSNVSTVTQMYDLSLEIDISDTESSYSSEYTIDDRIKIDDYTAYKSATLNTNDDGYSAAKITFKRNVASFSLYVLNSAGDYTYTAVSNPTKDNIKIQTNPDYDFYDFWANSPLKKEIITKSVARYTDNLNNYERIDYNNIKQGESIYIVFFNTNGVTSYGENCSWFLLPKNIGESILDIGNNFKVWADGTLKATTGKIGPWTLEADGFKSRTGSIDSVGGDANIDITSNKIMLSGEERKIFEASNNPAYGTSSETQSYNVVRQTELTSKGIRSSSIQKILYYSQDGGLYSLYKDVLWDASQGGNSGANTHGLNFIGHYYWTGTFANGNTLTVTKETLAGSTGNASSLSIKGGFLSILEYSGTNNITNYGVVGMPDGDGGLTFKNNTGAIITAGNIFFFGYGSSHFY